MVDEFLQAQQSMKAPGLDGWWTHARPVLSDEQWESLMEAGRSRGISHRAISVVLDGWGVQVSPAQVGHWRRTHVR